MQGPRVMLRPLEVGDHAAWKEIRVRGREWLEPWEPSTEKSDIPKAWLL